MKKLIIKASVALFLFNVMPIMAQEKPEEVYIVTPFQMTFQELINELEQQVEIKFIYNPSEVKDLKVNSVNFENLPLNEVIEFIRKNFPLHVTVEGHQVRLQRDEKKMAAYENYLSAENKNKNLVNLDEVVITGYGGTQQKSKSTHSIASVKAETLEKGSFSNPAQALSGAVSGLRVAQTSGKGGAMPEIILRGGTNLDGTGSPLVIVDGQVRGGLNDINSNDIESIELMKDAGATAIYGARANNGVVLVITKKGKKGRASIDVKIKNSYSFLNNPYNFLDAKDYLYWQRMAYWNSSRIYQNSAGEWKGFANATTLGRATPYGTGNIHFHPDNPTETVDPNTYSQAVYSTMLSENLTAEQKALLLSQGWQTMQDPVTGKELIFSNFNRAQSAFRPFALTKDYNISISGGNDKGKYFASLGFFDQENLPIKSWYKRINFTLNGEYKIKDWITSISNFSLARATWYDNLNNIPDRSYFGRMLSAPPTQKEYVNGKLVLGPNYTDGNPLYSAGKFVRDNNTNKFNMGQSFKLNLYKGLTFTLNGYVMFDEGIYERFDKDFLKRPNVVDKSRISYASFGRTTRQTYNGILNYKFNFKNHSFDAMAGYEYYDNYYKSFSAEGREAPTDDFMDLGLTTEGEGKRKIDSEHSQYRIKSYFGRVNYDYDAKYLASFTVRKDGYSSLLNNRWGVFPGVSLGWVLTREGFIPDKVRDILSFAKIRASFGLNGNASGISAYQLQGSYNSIKYKGKVGYVIGTSSVNGERIVNLPNPGLRWEKSRTFEVGADLRFLQNKISTSITYYNRLTEDKYASIKLPVSSGISAFTTNNGELRNQGVEIETDFMIINKKDWKWNLSFNAAYNKNTIEKLPYNGLERNRQNAFEVYDGTTGNKIWVGGYQEGQSPGDIYVFKAKGIYQSEQQIIDLANNLIDESTAGHGSDNKVLYGPAAWAKLTDDEKAGKALPIQPGDVIWEDVNQDGKIDDFDKVKIGNMFPKWIGGFSTSLSYKGFILSARMDYALNFTQVVDGTGSLPWILGNMQGTFNSIEEVKQTWTPENPGAPYPKYTWADQLGKRNFSRRSTLFAYEGSYLAFREVSLAYQVPESIYKNSFIQKLDISVTGQNLGYLTQSKAFSPEDLGVSMAGYPLPRTLIIGLNISF